MPVSNALFPMVGKFQNFRQLKSFLDRLNLPYPKDSIGRAGSNAANDKIGGPAGERWDGRGFAGLATPLSLYIMVGVPI